MVRAFISGTVGLFRRGAENVSTNFRQNSISLWISCLLVAIIVVSFSDSILVTVPSGSRGVLFHRFSGTDMETVYGEGLTFLLPWDIMYIYTVRQQTAEREFRMLTDTGLPVVIKVAIRFHPDVRLLHQLHVSVGPDYLENVVIPQTEAVLRRFLGQYTPEEIYTTKRGLLDAILMDSLSKAQAQFIVIDDVLIKEVNLPQPIQQAIEDKLVLQQQEKAFAFRLAIETQEAERKRIEAGGIRDFQHTIKENLDDRILRWQGIQATRDLANSNNAKMVVIGNGKDGLPVILGGEK